MEKSKIVMEEKVKLDEFNEFKRKDFFRITIVIFLGKISKLEMKFHPH